MSEDDRDFLSPPTSKRREADHDTTTAEGLSRSPADSIADVSMAHRIYYPCFGKVDIKSYIDARLYGFSFQRLHDEWVLLGKPRLDTSHWPRMPGHKGLPTSPEDFLRVAEYYDTKIYEQVLLEAQGKPAIRDRPLDDYFGSMATTAAIVKADFAVHRLVVDQPGVEEAAVQQMWYQTFSTFLQDSIRYFVSERTICERLDTHRCVVPLLFGEAHYMALPKLLETLTFQMQILNNVFPNFGEHFSRCAAARTQLKLTPSLAVTTPHIHSRPAAATASAGPHDTAAEAASPSTSHDPTLPTDTSDVDFEQQQLLLLSQPLTSIFIPDELKQRDDLFAATRHPAIRCDVPFERVVALIDSGLAISGSASASSASTPTSIMAPTPVHGVSAGTSAPPPDTLWQKGKRAGLGVVSRVNPDAYIESTNLTLRPSVQSEASWSEGGPGRSQSEESNTLTPDEALAAHRGRTQAGSAYPYFSSLPATPIEMLSPNPLLPSQDGGSSAYLDRRLYDSGQGSLSISSTSDADSRKRSRAEQNREKMKAYHRRVMQQREALTSVLTDLTANVGSVPLAATRGGTSSLMGPAPVGMSSEPVGAAAASSSGRSMQEPSWTSSLRNKQKQESKARLRKREIDEVHELRLYASYATATLARSSGPCSSDTSSNNSAYPRSSGASRAEGEQRDSAAAWRQLDAHQVSEADVYMSHGILRVFLRHRPSWIALISAEQRLASELTKLYANTKESRNAGVNEAVGGDGPSSGGGIKALLDWVQMEERAGRLSMPATPSTPMVPATPLFGHAHSRASTSGTGSFAVPGVVGKQRMAPGAAVAQPYERHGGRSQAGHIPAGALLLSPSSSDYGPTLSPSGVTQPVGTEEGGDYFSQDRRRYHGRYSDEAQAGASVLSAPASMRYSTSEHSNKALALRSPVAGMHRMAPSESGMSTPGVQSSSPGYGYSAAYAGEASQQERMALHGGSESRTHGAASGASVRQSASSMPSAHPQLRVSTHYDSRGYEPSMTQGGSASRMESQSGPYPSTALQSPLFAYPSSSTAQDRAQLEAQQAQQAHGLQGSTSMHQHQQQQQYPSSQASSPRYPPHPNQPNAYGPQGPYGGGQ